MKDKNKDKNKNKTVNASETAIDNTAAIVALEKKINALEAKNDEMFRKAAEERRELSELVTSLCKKIDALTGSENILCSSVEKLRDQMFTLGMAEVSQNGEVKNESYNNLILDETCALRSDVDELKTEMVNLKEQNAKLSVVSATDEKVEKLISSVGEVMSSMDDVKAGLELRSLNEKEPDTQGTLKSKDELAKSIDDLKKELSKIANDFSV